MSARLVTLIVALSALVLVSFAPAMVPAAAAPGVSGTVPSPYVALGTKAPSRSVSPSANSQTPSPRAALAQSILQKLHDAKVPMTAAYLPNLLGQARRTGNVIQPLYSVGPAPMGIGDFGVRNTTGIPSGYILQSTSWEGVLSLNNINALYPDSGVPDWFGAQLNTVMTNTTVKGNTTYRYWIQNVIQYSTLTNSLTFLDNIWNFSNPSTSEPAGTFYAGCPSGFGGPQPPVFYYCFGPTYTVPFPFTVDLFVNSSLTVNATTHQAWSTVTFGYNVLNVTGVSMGHGVYDTVLFNSNVTTASSPPTPKFTVNGFSYNPAGLLDDSELMIGGPGGGSTTTIYAINGTEQLKYLSAGTYHNDPTAWNEGTDTGETSEGISEYYTTQGTVHLSPGPSIPMPLWNATPTGNIGKADLRGVVTPSNSFFFLNQGSGFNEAQAAWAPVPASGRYDWAMPPGTYFVKTLASAYDANETDLSLVSGSTTYSVAMTSDPAVGIYAPLWAWTNAQIANISSSGTGSAAHPYQIDNNQYGALDPLFGEVNDFFYPVFSGIFLAYTSAHVDINQPASFYVVYPKSYDAALARFGMPDSNQLAIQAYYASNLSVWQGSFAGWSSAFLFGGGIFAPIGDVGFWGVTNSLVGDSVFTNQGSALLLAMGGDNVIWGNSIVPGAQTPSFYPYPFQFGIQVIESTDLIYNNYVAATSLIGLPAYAPNSNFYTGLPQVNRDDWNLSTVEPASQVRTVNGYNLWGSIVGSPWQCGNFWGNYVPGAALPYSDSGAIGTGGDFCPYPIETFSVTFTETGLSSGTWSAALAGMTESASAGSSIVFPMPNGTWSYTVGAVAGHTVNPATGVVSVAGAPRTIAVSITNGLQASSSASPTATDVGQAVSFNATPFGGSGTYTYAWSFGDGGSSSQQNPNHTYATAGAYSVTSWVNDSLSESVRNTVALVVNAAPTATASASASAVDAAQPVTFTGAASGGTNPRSLAWDFGDGSHSSLAAPVHAYAAPGSYSVQLTVTDAVGVTATRTLSITVSALPSASASASSFNPQTGEGVTFTGISTGGTGAITYAWTFGDGGTSSSQSPSHSYAATGTYTVHLWANDTAGGSATSTLTITVSSSVSTSTAATYTILALVAGLVVGVLVTMLLRRRKGGEGSEGPPKEKTP